MIIIYYYLLLLVDKRYLMVLINKLKLKHYTLLTYLLSFGDTVSLILNLNKIT